MFSHLLTAFVANHLKLFDQFSNFLYIFIYVLKKDFNTTSRVSAALKHPH